MHGFPVASRLTLAVATGCSALALSLAVQASGLDTLRDHDPALETVGPADAGFATSCRASARERLGGERLEFDRPAFAVRDGRQIVRMDLLGPGQRRDPDRLFRAVCVREAGQPVDAMIFDGPTNGIGPRVVAIPGPTPDMRPRQPEPRAAMLQGPDGAIYPQGYGNYYWLPGLAVPGQPFRDRRFHDRRLKPTIQGSQGQPFSFAAPKPKTQSMRFGSPATTRMGTGAFIR